MLVFKGISLDITENFCPENSAQKKLWQPWSCELHTGDFYNLTCDLACQKFTLKDWLTLARIQCIVFDLKACGLYLLAPCTVKPLKIYC